jgi:release factor glutamine methyltransferase
MHPDTGPSGWVVERLARAGCLAADEEATELIAASGGNCGRLVGFVERRCAGEPTAWITGQATFCGVPLSISPGVFVPRWQSEPLAQRAVERCPRGGRVIDLATGSGAIAAVVSRARPEASVLGTEIDPVAAECARANGVEVVVGDLFDGVPAAWLGTVDLVVGVLPYVPTDALALLPRDVLTYEPRRALDGGAEGTEILRRAIAASTRWIRPGGCLLLEVGGEQAEQLRPTLSAAGFTAQRGIFYTEGDLRAVEAVAVLRHLAR